ncbi:MAG: YraN family protein [Lachnospiraceae bacterium]|nr:YraN family protein [Candidatus Colinaster equi]
MNKRAIGTFYEEAAIAYLTKMGIRIIDRNVVCGHIGEIDLIGEGEGCLIFFECKYRKNHNMGYPAEAVNLTKRQTIRKCAQYYLAYRKCDLYIRFDVVAIEGERIDWIKNAF